MITAACSNYIENVQLKITTAHNFPNKQQTTPYQTNNIDHHNGASS
jgi:hypothetical protein